MNKLSEKTVNILLHNVTAQTAPGSTLTKHSTRKVEEMDHIFHKVLDTHYPISIRNQRIIARCGNDEHKVKLREVVARQQKDFKK